MCLSEDQRPQCILAVLDMSTVILYLFDSVVELHLTSLIQLRALAYSFLL